MDADTLIARAIGLVEGAVLAKLPDPEAGEAQLDAMRPALRRFGRAWLGAHRGAATPRWALPRRAALLQLLARVLDELRPPGQALVVLRGAPRCGLCRRARGTVPGCLRCEQFVLSCREPARRKELAAALAELEVRRATERAQEDARLARLRGRPIRVGLVGCGKSKAAEPRPAKELYTGRLFRAARAYAEQTCDAWVILSALHGVLEPEHIVAPYEQTLRSLRDAERAVWSHQVRTCLAVLFEGLDVQYGGLAGEEYLDAVPEVRTMERPLRGMGIGQRIKFLQSAVTAPV